MRQQFSENAGTFLLIKPGTLGNSGGGLPTGGASLKSSKGFSLPEGNMKKKLLPPEIKEAVEVTVMKHNRNLKMDQNCHQKYKQRWHEVQNQEVSVGPSSNYSPEILQTRMAPPAKSNH